MITHIYCKSGINVIRFPLDDLVNEKITVSNVELLVWDEDGSYHFEANELAREIAETENLFALPLGVTPEPLIDDDIRKLVEMSH